AAHLATREITGALPPSGQAAVLQALGAFRAHTGLLAGVGLVGLFWSGSGLFGAMDQGLSTIAGCRPRGFLRQKAMAAVMIVLFTALLAPIVLSSSLLSALQALPVVPLALRSGPGGLILQVLVAVLDGTLLFTVLYVVVPNRRHRARAVLPAAFAAGLLLEAFSLLFTLYFRLAHGFNQYGSTFALFFLLIFFAFALSQITVLGYCVGLAAEERHRVAVPPAPPGPAPAPPDPEPPAVAAPPPTEAEALSPQEPR
ncbi:MAG TPA: YihY/virulence factor BrkB family protein, partial [Candidatus Dormibacteraeota bacterium]|nr:YihY/virulence factor BrkB family protein [Candidatus Dormibacteraeota bacterium]